MGKPKYGTPKPIKARPTNEALRKMAADRMSTLDIATHCNITVHAVRKLMKQAGCRSDLKGWWHLPCLAPSQAAPKPTGKAVLATDFPFIKKRQVETATGAMISIPFITMRVVESGKFGSFAR